MFAAGEYIHYGSSGLCRIDAVTKLDLSGADGKKLYYRLIPLSDQGSTIYTPVDNQKVSMRRVLTKEEAESLIEELPAIGELHVEDERQREQTYKKALSSADCKDWVRMIKTLYGRRRIRLEQGKKTTATEDRYFKAGREMLHQEIALAVGIRSEDVEDFISHKLEQASMDLPV